MKIIIIAVLVATLFITEEVKASFNGIYGDRLDCVEECEKQFKQLKRYARNGSPRAQTLLGVLFRTGEMEVTPDEDDAWRWMKRANRQRFAPAQFHMARWYREGFRTEVDVERANELLSRSAEQGYIPAMFEMGVRLFEEGNYDQGIEYINTAYEQKYPLALKLADYLVEQTNDNQQALTTKPAVLRDTSNDENTLVIYGSKDKPEVLFVDLLVDLKDMGVYEERGTTGTRLGDTKCGEPGSGCKSYKIDPATISYQLRSLIGGR